MSIITRRAALRSGGIALTGIAAGGASALLLPSAGAAMPTPSLPAAPAMPAPVPRNAVRPELMREAMVALQRHGSAIQHRDVIGVADFARASGQPRFHLVNLGDGRTQTLLVSHGRGSDPAHRGVVERFSNEVGSAASSQGAYRTGALYIGKHGRSQRLAGLDPTNNNAEPRAVVVHGAWYVSPQMVAQHGKLGRSEGCFAFCENELEGVLARLGEGRMIYAAKA